MSIGEKSRRRILKLILLALGAVPLAYLLAAVAGSLIPRNAGWQEPPEGVTIFLQSNGIHVDLVLPARAAGVDLYRLTPPGHIPRAAEARGWISFGWGQREFYLQTEQWADLTPANAARAVFGGDALMHVEHQGRPETGPGMRPLRLRSGAYRRLAAAIAGSFERGPDGRAIPLTGQGYEQDDVFYEVLGRYSALRSSNQWTANRLAYAGVEVGVWTPFAQGIMWRFRGGADERNGGPVR